MAKYISRRVKKTPQTGITSDRYEFLGLTQAEPDLGDPIVGPSSLGAKPLPISGDQYVLVAYDNQPGSRYWVPAPNLQGSGLIPGAFTVFNNDNQVGLANSFNVFNFVGVAVTVDPVSNLQEEQTGIATVRIQVVDVLAPGEPYEIPFHDPVSGFLRGSSDFVFRDDNVGIGSIVPSEKLDVLGNIKISENIISEGAIIGLATITNINATEINSDLIDTSNIITQTGIVTSLIADSGVANTFFVNDLTAEDSYFENFNVNSGIITSLNVENLDVSGVSTFTTSVGINSSSPSTFLDVLGNVKFTGSIELTNGTGSVGQVLLSNGSSPASWGNFSDITVGSANSVAIANTDAAGNYYLNFSSEFDKVANIFVDSNSLVYNPSTNNLGIGSTNPQYSLDVVGDSQISGTLLVGELISRGSEAQEVTRSTSGIVTTNSLDPVVINSIEINTFRSAKYIIQITSNNSLGLGSNISVENLNAGVDYYPGVYENVPLEASTGNGDNALAEITVVPQFTLTPTVSSGGTFTFTGSSTGIQTGQTLFFNNTLDILPLEQSKLTEIQLTFSGVGYTTIPNFTIELPIISGNPVPGVGSGITATGAVDSMIVSEFEISVGIATTAYPTVEFSGPAVGTTATGVVGVGVSELTLTQVGTGYTVSPDIIISKVTDFSGIVGMGISESGWQVFGGSGYSSAPTIDIIAENGIGSGAVIEADIDADPPNGLINFAITNPGVGYTVPPTVSISGGGGSDATVVITTLITTNAIINNPGFGATTVIESNDIIIDPVAGIGNGGAFEVEKIIPTNVVPTNVGSGYTSSDLPVTATFSDSNIVAEVGLGVENISITNIGLGYTTLPSITFDSPTIGIAQTATAISTKLGYNQTALFNGPGFGGTEAVYYVIPLSSNTFSVSLTNSGEPILLGYNIPPETVASVGGNVNNVNITSQGSNYQVADVLTATNFDSNRIDTNVGAGFSFSVKQVVDNFQLSEVLLLQTADSGNSQAYVIENSGIADVIDLGNFSADISGQDARLIFTPVFTQNEIKYFRTAFVI